MSSMNPETNQPTRSMQSPAQAQAPSPMPAAMNPATSTSSVRRTSSWPDSRPVWLTTELIAYVVVVLGVCLSCLIVTDSSGPGDRDYFTADKAFFYITLLTIGYMISRGLAKIGGRPHSDI